jgi:hypothetical protein
VDVKALGDDADALMAGEGVRDVSRFVDVLTPGFK